VGLVFAPLCLILKRFCDHGYKILQCQIASLGVWKLRVSDNG
jgi:hypothetical protein